MPSTATPSLSLVRSVTKLANSCYLRCHSLVSHIGGFIVYSSEIFYHALHKPLRVYETIQQMEFVGYQSMMIISVAAYFTGAVFSLQVGEVISIFDAQSLIGAITCDALANALAPIITGFLVAGRIGSSMTAEIVSMKSKEQIDALKVMGVHPISYLVIPRVFACLFTVPCLTVFFFLFGSIGAFTVSTFVFFVDAGLFLEYAILKVNWDDISLMLGKSLVVGWTVGTLSCYFGLRAKTGNHGIGQATVLSVATTFIMIMILDSLITFIETIIL
ncbi:MAG: ABC transporter permease [Proteobacteria bacterium]|nr:ABC transporter permease [Pseudomonadota bacterium]